MIQHQIRALFNKDHLEFCGGDEDSYPLLALCDDNSYRATIFILAAKLLEEPLYTC